MRKSDKRLYIHHILAQIVSDFGFTLEPFRTFRVLNTSICTENPLDGRFVKYNVLGDETKLTERECVCVRER